MRRAIAVAVLTLVFATACGSGGTDEQNGGSDDRGSSPSEQRFPDVVEATARADGDTYTFDVTISSPYDTPDRYADGWRIKDGETVYGEHTLGHDHADEQPFTRTQSGVQIPADVTEVVVEGRDSEHGYGGKTRRVTLPEGG